MGDPPASDEHEHECERGDLCSDPRLIRGGDGSITRAPALTPRAFCEADTLHIGACLAALPSAWDRLGAEIGQPRRRGTPARSPFGPRLPLHADIDALMRLTASTLCAWEARVRTTAGLVPRADPTLPVNTHEAVKQSADTLRKDQNLSVLLALQPAWMLHVIPLAPGKPGDPAPIPPDVVTEWGDLEIVRLGPDSLTVVWVHDGTDAGLQILDLHYEARRILGETRPAPDSFDGVPCRNCEDMALERAEPPSNPEHPAMHSRCASCGHTMDRRTFLEWVDWYAAWADKAGLTCRRCRAVPPRCGECAYQRCACRLRGHAASAA